MTENENLLLAVLNSTPVVAGAPTDELTGARGRERLRALGGSGSADELEHVRVAREAIRGILHGRSDRVSELESLLENVSMMPTVSTEGVAWTVRSPSSTELAARVVMAWSEVTAHSPGRLRPCGNDECRLFLIDHSRPGTAKWCSMATCGNRMKARAHVQRQRAS